MKLKFLKTVATAQSFYLAGSVHEIKDRHAAELYVARGDAAPEEPKDAGNLHSTLGVKAAPGQAPVK